MEYKIAIETGNTGLWYGRIIDFPGTHARARSLPNLLKELEEEAYYHNTWLRRHGETQIDLDDLHIKIVERINDVNMLGESGGEVALFEFDLESVNDDYLKKCIKYMEYNREDLLILLIGVNKETLNFIPPGKKRNMVQILGHICNVEEWYISRLGLDAEEFYKENLGVTEEEADNLPIHERMKIVRNAVNNTLFEIIPKREGVFTRQEYCLFPDEKWSARKVLRRFLEHEREHIYNIRWYLRHEIRRFP